MAARGVAAPVTPALGGERASDKQGAKKERERGDPHVGEKSGPAGPPLGEGDFFQAPPSKTARESASIVSTPNSNEFFGMTK